MGDRENDGFYTSPPITLSAASNHPITLRTAYLLHPIQRQGVHREVIDADRSRGHAEGVENRFLGRFGAGFEEGRHAVVGNHAAGGDLSSRFFRSGETAVASGEGE